MKEPAIQIGSTIENTLLKPDMVQSQVDQLVKESIDFGFHGVCVPPFWVKHAKREIGNAGLRLITVVGYPLGYQLTESKLDEINRVIDHGADEVDMVWNLSAFKSGMPWTKIELARCTQLAHSNQRLIKIILETALLSTKEIEEGATLCADAGADFVKTSTGQIAGGGATLEVIQLLRKILPANVGIKASGGIKTAEQALEFIKAGADRIGTSAGPAIMAELKGEKKIKSAE